MDVKPVTPLGRGRETLESVTFKDSLAVGITLFHQFDRFVEQTDIVIGNSERPHFRIYDKFVTAQVGAHIWSVFLVIVRIGSFVGSEYFIEFRITLLQILSERFLYDRRHLRHIKIYGFKSRELLTFVFFLYGNSMNTIYHLAERQICFVDIVVRLTCTSPFCHRQMIACDDSFVHFARNEFLSVELRRINNGIEQNRPSGGSEALGIGGKTEVKQIPVATDGNGIDTLSTKTARDYFRVGRVEITAGTAYHADAAVA